MASLAFPSFPILLILISIWVLLISPGQSLTCNSQKLSSKKLYSNCTDLPTLNSTLHFSYNATNSSLSVAFVAAPAKPEGWIAWAINPTGIGMLGAQSFIAFKSNGSVVVKMYNISGYSSILETKKLAFEVWDLSAESYADSQMVIYASVKVPEKKETVNQVWQVGSNVTDGHPMKHEMTPANLGAKEELQLVAEKSTAAGTPEAAPTPSKGSSSNNENGSGSRDVDRKVGLRFAIVAAAAYAVMW